MDEVIELSNSSNDTEVFRYAFIQIAPVSCIQKFSYTAGLTLDAPTFILNKMLYL